ncbi:MAG: flagellin [Phycisphaerae bacterium]
MSEIEGIFKTPFRNWLFREDYDWATGSYKTAGSDREVAVIREYLLGNIADVRLRAKEANAAISMVQTIEHAATTLRDKLTLMEKLAEKAANGYYTNTDKASMQKHLTELAKDINDIVDSTEYDGNKLFTSEGQAIVKSIGDGRSFRLFAKDLSFNVENVDLAKDAKAALTTIRDARKRASEYTNYLKSQNELLQDEMATVEQKMASSAGIESSDFETKIMQQFIKNLSSSISNDTNVSTDVQANITSHEALPLLND